MYPYEEVQAQLTKYMMYRQKCGSFPVATTARSHCGPDGCPHARGLDNRSDISPLTIIETAFAFQGIQLIFPDSVIECMGF